MSDKVERCYELRYSICFTPWLTCNAECGHCITNSGPRVKDRLSTDVIKRCLSEAAELGIDGYQFTGGEPTLFLKDLLNMLEWGSSLGMKAGMTSNAYFAKTYDQGYKVLKQLADRGMQTVRFSSDTYHEPFMPFERVLFAVQAAVALKLETSVEVILVRKDSKLGDVVKAIQQYPEVRMMTGSLVRQGRGKNLPENLFLTYPYHLLKQVPCAQAATVFIDADGQTYYCCNFPRPSPGERLDTSSYVIGNVYHQSLGEILEGLQGNSISKTLVDEGPMGILDRLKTEYGEEEIRAIHNTQQRYYGLCDFCHSILSNKRLVPLVRGAVCGEKDQAPATSLNESAPLGAVFSV